MDQNDSGCSPLRVIMPSQSDRVNASGITDWGSLGTLRMRDGGVGERNLPLELSLAGPLSQFHSKSPVLRIALLQSTDPWAIQVLTETLTGSRAGHRTGDLHASSRTRLHVALWEKTPI